MQVGSFGQTIFEVSADRVLTPSSFSREVKARYEEHKVLGAAPRLEFLAQELPTMELSVRFHAAFGVNPLAECKKLEAACLAGKVEKLIIGGSTWGDMVLESISDRLPLSMILNPFISGKASTPDFRGSLLSKSTCEASLGSRKIWTAIELPSIALPVLSSHA